MFMLSIGHVKVILLSWGGKSTALGHKQALAIQMNTFEDYTGQTVNFLFSISPIRTQQAGFGQKLRNVVWFQVEFDCVHWHGAYFDMIQGTFCENKVKKNKQI